MRHIRAILVAMAGFLLILVPGVRADSLQLKNGNMVEGKYLGGTERAVQFEVNGKIRLYGVEEILSISFAAAPTDGVIPSNKINPEPKASTESNSKAKDSSGSRTAVWEHAATKVLAKSVAMKKSGLNADAHGRQSQPAVFDRIPFL